jgi:uncharacterized membrane protein YeiB
VRSLEPHTDTADRIPSLDILRGLALLGMFVVHFHARSTEPGGIDELVRTLVWRLVESKSHGTFALLFGAGFAIQLRRAEARGAPFAQVYLRRLGVLAFFGFAAHAFRTLSSGTTSCSDTPCGESRSSRFENGRPAA